jgi:hypothetical protein
MNFHYIIFFGGLNVALLCAPGYWRFISQRNAAGNRLFLLWTMISLVIGVIISKLFPSTELEYQLKLLFVVTIIFLNFMWIDAKIILRSQAIAPERFLPGILYKWGLTLVGFTLASL